VYQSVRDFFVMNTFRLTADGLSSVILTPYTNTSVIVVVVAAAPAANKLLIVFATFIVWHISLRMEGIHNIVMKCDVGI